MFLDLQSIYERMHEYQTFSQRPDMLILSVLASVGAKRGHSYCFPSQDTICRSLAVYGRRMSRRTLNRHLNSLVRQGWITRQRRHTRHTSHGFAFKSTLYKLTRRSFRWLSGLHAAARRAVKWAGAVKRTSRVPNSAQHIPLREYRTGRAPQKPGAPPGNNNSVARDARTVDKKQDTATHLSGRAAEAIAQMRKALTPQDGES